MKRNKEFIATNIQEIFNPFNQLQLAAHMSQPIDLQKLFMHQLQQQNVVPAQLLSPQTMQQELALQAAAANVVSVNGNNTVNPILNGCTTMVTNTNINVTYLNGAIGGNNKYDVEKFKMHQGFIAVLKVISYIK